MQVPAEITFKNYTPSRLVRAEIVKQLDKLKTYSDRVTSCKVVLEKPRDRHHAGSPFKTNIVIAMPRHKDIVVNRSHADVAEHEHVLVTIRDAFAVAGKQIKEAMHALRHETKVHIHERHGVVCKFLAGENAGFIKTPEDEKFYFHSNSVLNNGFMKLCVGAEVRFVEETGEKGPYANSVQIIGKPHMI